MTAIIRLIKKIDIKWIVVLGIMTLALGSCKEQEKIFIVGMGTRHSSHLEIFEGFKAGMAEFGYVEGKNIRYTNNGVMELNEEIVDDEVKRLLSNDLDLLLTTGNTVSLSAKKAVKGIDVPVVIAGASKPFLSDIASNLQRPGGNLTGVIVEDTIAKGLEWLVNIKPGVKKVYLPYNPEDWMSAWFIPELEETASRLRIELVVQKIHSVEEALAAIETMHEDIDAIYRIPSPTLDERNAELSRLAITYGLLMGSPLPLDEDVLITFADDFFVIGKQAARLAHQIFQGVKPGDIPIETSEALLIINLKTAEKIGLTIPGVILYQADKIVR